MNAVYYGLLPPAEVARAARRELFDELEEWHLIQAHYGLVVAVLERRVENSGEQAAAAAEPAEGAAAAAPVPGSSQTLADALGFFDGDGVVDDDDGFLCIPAAAGRYID